MAERSTENSKRASCCTPEEAWIWVGVLTADALTGAVSPALLARAVDHALKVRP